MYINPNAYFVNKDKSQKNREYFVPLMVGDKVRLLNLVRNTIVDMTNFSFTTNFEEREIKYVNSITIDNSPDIPPGSVWENHKSGDLYVVRAFSLGTTNGQEGIIRVLYCDHDGKDIVTKPIYDRTVIEFLTKFKPYKEESWLS